MDEISDPGELRGMVLGARCGGRTVGLVPTMGYLHAGHARLMEEARQETDLVVVSIFVNPTQFGPTEDFARYPRDLDGDRRLAAEHGVDILFVPTMESIYAGGPSAQEVWVDPGSLAAHLEGASRPGHFRGVTTVVAKLLNLALPDRAYFGQKDAQQAIVITALVRDLAFPLEIRVVPTVREIDGLALSSRNVYLSPEERSQAAVLYESLRLARQMLAEGERIADRIEEAMREMIGGEAPLGRIDYVSVADLATLRPVEGVIESDVLVSLAVVFGTTRLIDNVIVRFEGDEVRFPPRM